MSLDGASVPVRGILGSVESAAVVLEEAGVRREIQLHSVSRIERAGDSVANGFLIGMAVAGGWCARVCGQGVSSPGAIGPVVVGNALIGGLIGVAIDARKKGTTTVYRRRGSPRVAVVIGRGRVGLLATLGAGR